MYVKLKEEKERYHYCREHLKEIGELDSLDQPDQLKDDTFSKPDEVCDECQDLAEEGHCHPLFVVSGSFTD